jgi:hypothetical protein
MEKIKPAPTSVMSPQPDADQLTVNYSLHLNDRWAHAFCDPTC